MCSSAESGAVAASFAAEARRAMTVSLYDGRLLNEWMRDNGFSERHADQLRTHLIRRPCGSLDDLVSGVPDFDRKCARRVAEAGRRRELSCMTSRIGAVRECVRTTKLQVNLQDGSSVETVIIRQSSWTYAPVVVLETPL